MPASTPVWQRHAQQWDLIGPPLRPVPEDVAFTAAALNGLPHADEDGALSSILLGVTPELAAILTKTRMLSIDHSIDMVRAIWSRHDMGSRARPVVADWRALPLPADIADFVAGDGCFTTVQFPDGYALLAREIARVLKPSGRFVIRLFVSPPRKETVEEVIADLMNRRIANFHVFKWRLVMALQPRPQEGTRLGDVWAAWAGARVDSGFLTNELGWPAPVVDTIKAYRDSNTRFTFPTLSELRPVLAQHFREVSCHVPGYPIGERCPSLLLEKH
jgi:SAM-dependent methyltransferase